MMDATAPDTGVRAEFTGARMPFFRLALIGTLLQVPTLGFYRFWLITDIRRHLWSHTRFGSDAFEYTGRARELLIGFLIALAILTPIYIGYFLLSIEAERWQAFASLPLLLVIYVLMNYGAYRARRYRATRTIFRGTRLWMDGSGWVYALRALGWDALTLVTLGLALPWRMAALEHYRMRHTHYGDLAASFLGTGGGLFKRGWWLWLLVLSAPLALAITAFGASGAAMTLIASIIPALTMVTLAAVYPLFRAIELRWRLEGMRFGETRVQSTLRKRSVLWCYVKAMLLSLLFFVLFGAVIGGLTIALIPDLGALWRDMAEGMPPAEAFPLILIGYLGAALGLALIFLQVVTRGVWRLTVNSLTVFNLAALDAVAVRGAAASGVGEGLADALDFGGGV